MICHRCSSAFIVNNKIKTLYAVKIITCLQSPVLRRRQDLNVIGFTQFLALGCSTYCKRNAELLHRLQRYTETWKLVSVLEQNVDKYNTFGMLSYPCFIINFLQCVLQTGAVQWKFHNMFKFFLIYSCRISWASWKINDMFLYFNLKSFYLFLRLHDLFVPVHKASICNYTWWWSSIDSLIKDSDFNCVSISSRFDFLQTNLTQNTCFSQMVQIPTHGYSASILFCCLIEGNFFYHWQINKCK